MTRAQFDHHVARLRSLHYREDFQASLYDLYITCDADQRALLRHDLKAKTLTEPQAWKNPTDYHRSDLTREQKARRSLVHLSMFGLSPDIRNDLCTIAHDYHTLALLGFDPDAILDDIATLSAPDVAHFLRAFIARDPKEKSMEAFSLQVVQMPNGPAINRVSNHSTNPA